MEQLYIEALLIHWHTGLKFSSENRDPQILEVGRKNWPIHPKVAILSTIDINSVYILSTIDMFSVYSVTGRFDP